MMSKPTPSASSPEALARMTRQRQRDTRPELELRSALHRLGLRFFVHRRPIPGFRREADVVFPRARVAVFVDSCFWHGCPEHMTWPVANAEWWREKIGENIVRDRDTGERLAAAGWSVIRVWEHESPSAAADRVQVEVMSRSNRRGEVRRGSLTAEAERPHDRRLEDVR
jgi:DNA mismatch endonuclease, patch repair protein